MSESLRLNLVQVALEWQRQYGVAPSITSTLSEYDAAKLVGMSDAEYSNYMQDKTAVTRGHDFIYKGIRYSPSSLPP